MLVDWLVNLICCLVIVQSVWREVTEWLVDN
jgi:hypothetical protein